MKTLTDRKIAEQERVNCDTPRQAQIVRQQLEQATALAATQAKVNAEADATVVRTVGVAEASKTRAVGGAEAEVMKLKIASMESGTYAMVQIAEAMAKGGVKLVPDIVAGAGSSNGMSTPLRPTLILLHAP